MEEIQVKDGKVMNASFTDYLLPDDPGHAAGGIQTCSSTRIRTRRTALKGVGEPPNISTPPAVAAALRDATGRAADAHPGPPEHLVCPSSHSRRVAAAPRTVQPRCSASRGETTMSFYVAAEPVAANPPSHPVDEVLPRREARASTAPSTCSRSTRAR